jgi:hypothetical protein
MHTGIRAGGGDAAALRAEEDQRDAILNWSFRLMEARLLM